MDVNGVTNVLSAYNNYEPKVKDNENKDIVKPVEGNEATTENGVIYEPSAKADEAVEKAKKYTPNTELIAKLKADAEERTAQLRSIVEKLITGQGNALGEADDIWAFLRKGDFTVDEATKLQAQADIAEDGYWGVEQTSDRILDFAKALTGGDPDKIEEMRKAFEDGFKLATKTWGDKLPDISQKTYDAVMQKFDKWAEEAGVAPAESVDGTVTETTK